MIPDVPTPTRCPYTSLVRSTWTARDACGNQSTASQVVHVTDTTPPVIAGVGGAQSIQCGAALQFSSPAVSDACDGNPTLTFADATTSGSCAQSYDVTRTWTARDAGGKPT